MMNENQILAATMQQLVMDAVANYRVKQFSDRDVHTYLLYLEGMKLLNIGFTDDAVKLLTASINSQNMWGLLMLQAMAKENPDRKDLKYAINKLEAQRVGLELDSSELIALMKRYNVLTMDLNDLKQLVRKNLYDEQKDEEDCFKPLLLNQMLQDARELMKKANILKWGDYKPWPKCKVSTPVVYEAALRLYLGSVHSKQTEGLAVLEDYLKKQENPELLELLNDLKNPTAETVTDLVTEQKKKDDKKTEPMNEKQDFDLERFLKAQAQDYETALMEIYDGEKESHWIWYIFPQLKGLGHSYNSEYYGLDGREEAEAYLNHPVLGARLREISQTLLQHQGKSIYSIMGSSIDVLKLKTCMQLFDSISPNDVFDEVLDAFFMNEI